MIYLCLLSRKALSGGNSHIKPKNAAGSSCFLWNTPREAIWKENTWTLCFLSLWIFVPSIKGHSTCPPVTFLTQQNYPALKYKTCWKPYKLRTVWTLSLGVSCCEGISKRGDKRCREFQSETIKKKKKKRDFERGLKPKPHNQTNNKLQWEELSNTKWSQRRCV